MYRQRKVDSSSQESAGKKNSRSVAIYVDVGDAAKVKFQVVQVGVVFEFFAWLCNGILFVFVEIHAIRFRLICYTVY